MKYSHQMAAAAAAVTSVASRVPQIHHNGYPPAPQYPPYHEYDTTNLWNTHPHHQQQQQHPATVAYQQHHQSQHILLSNDQQIQSSVNQWHQPASTTSSDFHPVSSAGKSVSPASSAAISPPVGLTTLNAPSLSSHLHQPPTSGTQQIIPGQGIHHHPAFLQVGLV